METKVCTKCGVEKQINDFSPRKGVKSGRKSWCKECRNKSKRDKNAKRRLENPPKVRFYNDTHAECTKCGKIKLKSEFGEDETKAGVSSWCRECYRITKREKIANMPEEEKEQLLEYYKEYYRATIDNRKEVAKRYYWRNRDKRIAYSREYNAENRELLNKKGREKRKNMTEGEREVERECVRKYRERLDVKINVRMGNAIRDNLKNNRVSKNGIKWEEIVGYSVNDLKVHIESMFIEGMSWGNYGRGGWHIDHIIPLSMFKYDSVNHPNFKKAWALDNLQPLWESDNLVKHNKLYWGEKGTLDF